MNLYYHLSACSNCTDYHRKRKGKFSAMPLLILIVSLFMAPNLFGQDCEATGKIIYERWDGVLGNDVQSLLDSPRYPDTPSVQELLTNFDIPRNIGDQYAVIVRGYLCAPESGDYTFYVAGDDHAEIWLSTDTDPANITRLAYHTGWTYEEQWNKYTTQESDAVSLTAGDTYYIEGRFKEGGGGDHFSVGWKTPGTSQISIIPGDVLAHLIGDGEEPTGITIDLEDLILDEGNSRLITASVSPIDANQAVVWASDDPAVATVDGGLVTAVSAGATTISVTTSNGAFVATATVTVTAASGCAPTGSISMELFEGIPSIYTDSIYADPSYPDNPSSIIALTDSLHYEYEDLDNGDFGAVVRGYICAPETGNYTFWCKGDHNGDLFLSTDRHPENKKRIAYHNWHIKKFNSWFIYPSQKSEPIPLIEGRTYYIESVVKAGITPADVDPSGDFPFYLSVGWTTPGNIPFQPNEVIPLSVLSPFGATTSTNDPDDFENALSNVKIYPLVTRDILNVENAANANIVVYNLSGMVVATYNILSENESIHLDAAPGIYFMAVRKGNSVETIKVIKQ